VSNRQPPYHEELLHWIWKTNHFELQHLETVGGKPVQIHAIGRHNHSDGPDFYGAELTIGSLQWHGDVELHWSSSDWKTHGHHTNPRFNNVILHVVYSGTVESARRMDRSLIPTLCLKPYITQPLKAFIHRYQASAELPCHGKVSFISESAFRKQLEKAHKEYFEQKVDDLMTFFDPELPPSKAWQKLLGVAFCDGLGISHNRSLMQNLAQELWSKISSYHSLEAFRQHAVSYSGINKASNSWKHKGCRPGNHPRLRIQQGADALWHIAHHPLEQWMCEPPDQQWEQLLAAIHTSPSVGRQRSSILYGTVLLPALYLLGSLFFSASLKQRSWDLWTRHEAHIPKTLLRELDNTDLPSDIYDRKLGSIYQLRAYCHPKKCQDCKVFKSAISS